MQSDKRKLLEAHYRRVIGKAMIYLMAIPLADYAFSFASGGYRNLYGAGHWNLLILVTIGGIAVIILKPVFQLENPFQYSLEQKRKTKK